MNAKTVLVGTEERVHILVLCIPQRQIEPAHAVHQHVESRTQITGHDVHHTDLPPVGVEQHQLANSRCRHRFADVGPQPQDGLGLECERARKTRVFGAQADGLRRQHQHFQHRRQMRQRRSQYAVDQYRVHAQRQMRTMLLGGGNWQHGDGLRRFAALDQGGKVLRRKIGPESGFGGHGSILGPDRTDGEGSR